MTVSRRGFLKTSGALIVTFSMTPESMFAQRLDGASSNQLDAWLAINSDGTVTAYTGKCELGHGLYTAQTQLIAEELSVAFNRVKLIQCDTALTPDQGTTSGAQSHPTNFNQGALALAGATAREALFQMAATRFAVPADQLTARDGVIALKADSSKKVTYAELVGGKKFNLTLNNRAKRKNPAEWTVLGTPVPRIEIPAMATGEFEYVHNVRLPGMLYGQVVRPPAVGANVMNVDEQSVTALPGVVKVVVKKNFVGVVAEKPWQAMQAANKLKVDLDNGIGPAEKRRNSRLSAEPEADARHLPGQLEGRRRKARSGREGRQGDVLLSVSDARFDGNLVRSCRRARRKGHHLFSDPGGISASQHSGNAARDAAGECARDLQDGRRMLRHKRRGYRLVRRCAAVASRRQTRPHSADAQR